LDERPAIPEYRRVMLLFTHTLTLPSRNAVLARSVQLTKGSRTFERAEFEEITVMKLTRSIRRIKEHVDVYRIAHDESVSRAA
jgi:hypothetical protein